MARNGLERFRLNSRGAKDLIRSDDVRTDLLARAQRVAQVVRGRTDRGVLGGDDGIIADSYTGRGRAGATVIGVPMEVETRDRPLGSSIDAARD